MRGHLGGQLQVSTPTRSSGLISQKLVFLGELNVLMLKTLPRKTADEFYKT